MKKTIMIFLSIFASVCLLASACTSDPKEGEEEGGGEGPPKGTEYVSLIDYESFKEGSDWAPAFAEAFKDEDYVYVPSGKYPCSEVKMATGQTIQGAGSSTVFQPLGVQMFVIEGSIGAEIKIAADIIDFSNTIILSASGEIEAGDPILIRGQRNSMLREGTAGVNYNVDWVLGRTRESSCFFGEMDIVESVTGTKITTSNNRIFPDYFKDNSREPTGIGSGYLTRSATTVSKLTLVEKATLKNLAIEGTSKCYIPIRLSYCKDCLVEDVTFNTSVRSYTTAGEENLSLVYGLYAWNTTVSGFKAVLSSSLLAELVAEEIVYENFSRYNLFKMISCTNSGFENCEANGGSHAFNITRSASSAGRGGIPSIGGFVRNCKVSNCIWAGIAVQQGTYDTEITGNTVTGGSQGIITAGRKTVITNNTVETNAPYSTNHYYAHLSRGGTSGICLNEGYACETVVRNNKITNFHTGILILDGYEDKNCFEEGYITVENNTVTDCLRGFSIYKNSHNQSLGRLPLEITVSNNVFSRAGNHTLNINDGETSTYGIYIPNTAAGVTANSNTMENFRYGVWMDRFVDYVDIESNKIDRSEYGIYLTDITSNPSNYTVHIRQSGNTFTNTSTSVEGLSQGMVAPF